MALILVAMALILVAMAFNQVNTVLPCEVKNNI